MLTAALAFCCAAGLASPTPSYRQDDLAKGTEFSVSPIYVYPADQPYHPEYTAAIERAVAEVRAWYKAQTDLEFQVLPIKVIQAQHSYVAMRAGTNPDPSVRSDPRQFPAWWDSLMAVTGGPAPRTIQWVFAQGGGGVALANLWGDFRGFAIFGDWVLEPISGVREPAALHAGYATWEVRGGTPMGTTVHELGHAFGLHHPENYPGKSVMKAHWDYPNTALMPHERMILRHSPWFKREAFDESAPWLDFEIQDTCREGESLKLRGHGFKPEMKVEFRWMDSSLAGKAAEREQSSICEPKIESEHSAAVVVPTGFRAGFIRSVMGKKRGNAVPLNGCPKN